MAQAPCVKGRLLISDAREGFDIKPVVSPWFSLTYYISICIHMHIAHYSIFTYYICTDIYTYYICIYLHICIRIHIHIYIYTRIYMCACSVELDKSAAYIQTGYLF